jgi:hypothetical protein
MNTGPLPGNRPRLWASAFAEATNEVGYAPAREAALEARGTKEPSPRGEGGERQRAG